MKINYQGLFFLTFAYIGTMSVSSMMPYLWLELLFQAAAVALPFFLARWIPLCRFAVVDETITFSPKPIWKTLWLLPLFIGVVVGLSVLTTLVGNAVGVTMDYDYGDNIWLCLVTSALIPALTEELFCRYIFLPRLSAFSKSGAIFASALLFSFMHGNVLQIPYAFAAGLFLGALAVGCGSVLPGILFHLVNNVMSILLHFFDDTLLPQILLYVLLGTLAVSVVIIIVFRRRIWEVVRDLFRCDKTTGEAVVGLFNTPMVIFVIIFAFLAIYNIVSV